jgi:hypothetical protein
MVCLIYGFLSFSSSIHLLVNSKSDNEFLGVRDYFRLSTVG